MSELRADASYAGSSPPTAGLEPGRVEDLLRALSATVRSYRLYAGNGPTLDRFVDALREKIRSVWTSTESVRLEIGEQSITWEGHRVYPSGDSGKELAFGFYKDGIRQVTLLPGFEDEVDRLLGVLGRAPQVRAEEDDLITLLWQEDFASFKYEYVEMTAEGTELDQAPAAAPPQVDPSAVRQAAQTAPSAPSASPTDDFQETLYFLDDAELRLLQKEVRLEAERDLWGDVLNALFDRLEDGSAERQARVASLLAEVLPPVLGAGEFTRATTLLRELSDLASRPDLLAPQARKEVQAVFGQLARPETIDQLVRTLEGSPEALRGEALEALLAFFPAEALAPLMRAVEAVARPDVRRILDGAVRRLAEANREDIARLLGDEDPAVVAGAVRWIGILGIGSATRDLTRLLSHPETAIRSAAIGALVEIRAATAAAALIDLLEDPERDIRIAAARALASLEYRAARGVLESAIASKRLRAADRSERIAFFEAYGRLGGAEAVTHLDKILNAKSWLGRGESNEYRACAALALAKIPHPSARASLTAAAKDSDALVRTTVARALRGEEA